MTRLEIATKVLAGWAANPNERGTNKEAAAVALALADALLAAAGETPGDQYAAGFRAAVEKAAKVAESVPYVGGVKGHVAWLETCDAIRALAPAAPKDFPCCGGSDEDPPQHTQDCSVHPTACLQCRVKAGTVTVARNGRYEQNCPECASSAPKDAAPAEKPAPTKPPGHYELTCDGDGDGGACAHLAIHRDYTGTRVFLCCGGRECCGAHLGAVTGPLESVPGKTPAPPVAPVKFDAAGRAGEWARDGWDALHRDDELRVTVHLRPGEDAGEVTARMLASIGRGP